MPPGASRCCPCTTRSPTGATSSPWPAGDHWGPPRRRAAARVGIRAAASSASTPWAAWSPTGSRTPPPTGPGCWPGGPATPRPTSASPPATRFDVLDVDGPDGAHAIQAFAAEHGLESSGPLVRTGGGGWHYYLAPTGLGNVHPAGLAHVDWRGRGGYVVAPPSRHASGHPYQWVAGRDLDDPAGRGPGTVAARLEHRPQERPAGPIELSRPLGGTGDRYGQAALAAELARVAAAPVGQRNRQLWESTRNLYNLVATGALDQREVDHGLLQAAERCGLLAEEPRQTRRTLASGRQVGLAHPGRPAHPTSPERTHASPTRLHGRLASRPGEEVMAMAAAGHLAG